VRLHPRAARQYNAIGRLAREDPENEPIRKRLDGPGRRRRISLRGKQPVLQDSDGRHDTTISSKRDGSHMSSPKPSSADSPPTTSSTVAARVAQLPSEQLRRGPPVSRCCRSQRRATLSSETSTCALSLAAVPGDLNLRSSNTSEEGSEKQKTPRTHPNGPIEKHRHRPSPQRSKGPTGDRRAGAPPNRRTVCGFVDPGHNAATNL
jgi:hypothetical protein